MGENVAQQNIRRRQTQPNRQTREAEESISRGLLDVIVYGKSCRLGDRLSIDDLADTSEIGD